MTGSCLQIGFSQRIRLEWLEQTAALVVTDHDRGAAERVLQDLLKDRVSVGGSSTRGNREKVITILLKVWLEAPPGREALRLAGLEWLRKLPGHEHTAIHWGMVMATYPFWAEVATQVGRLLRLQGSAGAARVQRRVREQYGERETVSRATRRVLRSYVDWEVLQETDMKGVYGAKAIQPITQPALVAWLIEACLHARSIDKAPLNDLVGSPSLFPFRIEEPTAASLVSASPRLDLIRHGMDQHLVVLTKPEDAQSSSRAKGR